MADRRPVAVSACCGRNSASVSPASGKRLARRRAGPPPAARTVISAASSLAASSQTLVFFFIVPRSRLSANVISAQTAPRLHRMACAPSHLRSFATWVAGSDDVGAALFWRGGVKGAVCACKFEQPCLILRSALLLISFFFLPFFIPEESNERCWAATVHQKPVRHPLKLSSALTCPFKCDKVVIYHPGFRKSARFYVC